MQLGSFYGSLPAQQLAVSVSNHQNPSITHCLSLLPQSDGRFSLSTYLQPPYDLRVSSPHFLTAKAMNVVIGQNSNFALTNGDADGDNQINLFDFVVLDQHFGSSDMMADLNGDGQVNLFDYVVIDQNFGAQGD